MVIRGFSTFQGKARSCTVRYAFTRTLDICMFQRAVRFHGSLRSSLRTAMLHCSRSSTFTTSSCTRALGGELFRFSTHRDGSGVTSPQKPSQESVGENSLSTDPDACCAWCASLRRRGIARLLIQKVFRRARNEGESLRQQREPSQPVYSLLRRLGVLSKIIVIGTSHSDGTGFIPGCWQ